MREYLFMFRSPSFNLINWTCWEAAEPVSDVDAVSRAFEELISNDDYSCVDVFGHRNCSESSSGRLLIARVSK